MALSPEIQAVLDSVKAMPESIAKGIDIPTRPFLQIASRVCEAGRRDIERLRGSNYDVSKINTIGLYIGALREQSALYNNVVFDLPETQREFVKAREEAEEVRYEMLCAMDYAFANDENLCAKVSRIREGNSNADLIQDLTDAKVICESNIALLESINFDKTILDRIQPLTTRLSSLLAKATLDKQETPEQRLERDKLFTLLKGMLKELSMAANYTFRHDSEYASRYNINYTPRKKKSKETSKNSVAA